MAGDECFMNSVGFHFCGEVVLEVIQLLMVVGWYFSGERNLCERPPHRQMGPEQNHPYLILTGVKGQTSRECDMGDGR